MNFRRYYVPNAVVFITQVVQGREPVFKTERHLELLCATLRTVQRLYPFSMLAYAFLPDHFHLLLKPTGQNTTSQIMHSLKPNFTKAYKQTIGVTGPMKFWQKRFWDHVIRNEDDFRNHLDYIHYNPVRHGLAARPEDWLHSSFAEWKKRGAYSEQWGWMEPSCLVPGHWDEVEQVTLQA